jgi:endonuclease/exonuclease/phosphatase (EEP) superfamily protein YafD
MSSAAPAKQTVKVVSWNSQGKPDQKEKLAELDAFRSNAKDAVVVFVQEGGNADWSKRGSDWWGVAGAQVGTKNARCTMYVLVNGGWLAPDHAKPYPLKTPKGGAVIGGGEAGREAAGILIGKTLFVSWHSSASGDNSDTADMIGGFQFNTEAYTGVDMIVVGADFNAKPEALERMLLQGSERAKKQFWVEVYATNQATYKGKPLEIDYFLVFRRSQANFTPPSKPTLVVTAKSDHNAVGMSVDIPL